jgi:hypothetical protein
VCRAEVLSQHIPADDDEWMMREMKRLVQFTRIFPLDSYYRAQKQQQQPLASGMTQASPLSERDDDDAVDRDDDDDDGDEDNEKQKSVGNDADKAGKPAPFKSASYEEILYQAWTTAMLPVTPLI